jgi:methionyl-tRNA formyltransferase
VTSQLRIIYAGTPEFAVPGLEALLTAGQRVVAVYTQPDRPAGRGRQLAQSAVKQCALRHGLPVEQPLTLRDAAAVERLRGHAAQMLVVAAYGLILPPAVLALPPLGCINIHASLLPRWRGAAPIQRAILAGDVSTGVTIMRMDAGLDTGPMLLERSIAIEPTETAASVHDRLAELGATALLQALPGIADGSLLARPQPLSGVTYAAKIRKEEASIDWRNSAQHIERLVRGFNPWPVAETYWNERQLRVWQALALDEQIEAQPGQVVEVGTQGVLVATGSGVLALTQLQLAGGKVLAAADFVNAQRILGARLGRNGA